MFWKLQFCIRWFFWYWGNMILVREGRTFSSCRARCEMICRFFPRKWDMQRSSVCLSLDVREQYWITSLFLTQILANNPPHTRFTAGHNSTGDNSFLSYGEGRVKRETPSDQYSCSTIINNLTTFSVFSFFDLLLSSCLGVFLSQSLLFARLKNLPWVFQSSSWGKGPPCIFPPAS